MNSPTADALSALRKRIADRYGVPSLPRALCQLVVSLGLLVALWTAALWCLDISPWLTLALAFPIAGMLVRLFIIQHDCGHGSYFKSRRANELVGSLLGVLSLVPYHYWLRTHAMHHATSGNLDRRGVGDITTLTVREYEQLSRGAKLRYRLYRNPLVMFGIGAIAHFVIVHRWPPMPPGWRRERLGLVLTNVALAAIVVSLCLLVGTESFLLVQAPVTGISCAAGVWLFYVQHQFESPYWKPDDEWEFERAGLEGSTYYRLPKVLQWFTGNIGLHHVHHLSSKIPNYRLEKCLRENPDLQHAPTLSLFSSIRCAWLKLWDEERARLVSFRDARRRRRADDFGAQISSGV